MAEELEVWLGPAHVGTITRSANGIQRIQFRVDQDYDGGLSALSEGFSTFPGRVVEERQASNFFGGYVPEGPNRTKLAERKRIDETGLFDLLRYYGLTLAGAISIRSTPADDREGTYRALTNRNLADKLASAIDNWDLGNEPDSGRSAVPGFQPKLLLAQFDGTWYQPEQRAHSTHIVKPVNPRRPEVIFDEWLSHELGRHMDLTHFASELSETAGRHYLAIERYDRIVDGDHRVVAVHQEDAAQALGLDWQDSKSKFQSTDWVGDPRRPSAKAIAELFGSFGTGSDLEKWLRYLTFNVLVGNHDGHAKNVAIVHDGEDSRISDLYDAVPILHINDLPTREGATKINDEMSLAIDGEFSHSSITRENLANEARSWGFLSENRIDGILDDTFDRFADALDHVIPHALGSANLVDRLDYNVNQIKEGKPIGKPKASTLVAFGKRNDK